MSLKILSFSSARLGFAGVGTRKPKSGDLVSNEARRMKCSIFLTGSQTMIALSWAMRIKASGRPTPQPSALDSSSEKHQADCNETQDAGEEADHCEEPPREMHERIFQDARVEVLFPRKEVQSFPSPATKTSPRKR